MELSLPEVKGVPPVVLVVAAGAVLGFLLRKQSAPAAPGVRQGPTADEIEYIRIVSDARRDTEQFAANIGLETKRADYEFQLSHENGPAGLRTCVSREEWLRQPQAQRRAIQSQVRNGKAVLQPYGKGGVCVVPTVRGREGHAPIVTYDSSQGLFSTSNTVTGPGDYISNPGQAPSPGIFAFLQSLIPLFTGGYGGSQTGGYGGGYGGGYDSGYWL